MEQILRRKDFSIEETNFFRSNFCYVTFKLIMKSLVIKPVQIQHCGKKNNVSFFTGDLTQSSNLKIKLIFLFNQHGFSYPGCKSFVL